ncbi:Small nuclear ribonucleoprotein Sm D3 [Galemys pyrenaicus]|uniref:Small nuclear ribonucleoprotein Sm D3 n=1 Tax=Galemys pyrenaicus TaxID=202257 RepID=A0A8J6AK19_GALPY|nr:Small nuclear ribonucleoprotein Sm D3 [Galemys pyrenaicus]
MAPARRRQQLQLLQGRERDRCGSGSSAATDTANFLPAKMSIGVPIKVLHEAEGHIVTCETNTGEVYRGKLIEAEDNMNCQVSCYTHEAMGGACTFVLEDQTVLMISFQMSNITVTYRDGRVAQLEQVYIRGSKIRFLILPDMLKNAPMLKSMKNKNQGSGAGRGKAAILKAQESKVTSQGTEMNSNEKWLQEEEDVEWDVETSSRSEDKCIC